MGVNMSYGQTSIRLEPNAKKWLEEKAASEGRTISNLIKYIVSQYITNADRKINIFSGEKLPKKGGKL